MLSLELSIAAQSWEQYAETLTRDCEGTGRVSTREMEVDQNYVRTSWIQLLTRSKMICLASAFILASSALTGSDSCHPVQSQPCRGIGTSAYGAREKHSSVEWLWLQNTSKYYKYQWKQTLNSKRVWEPTLHPRVGVPATASSGLMLSGALVTTRASVTK